MIVYADSSLLVSVYIEDTHSAAADELLRSDSRVLLTPLHVAEWAHAVAQQVFRGRISIGGSNAARARIRRRSASRFMERSSHA